MAARAAVVGLLYRGPRMRKCVGIFFVCDAVGGVAFVFAAAFAPLRRGRFCLVFWPLRWHPRFDFVVWTGWFACVFAGVRAMPSCFTRCPCAGRHLLFFAAAKKSRQKKAANTARYSSCLRAPNRSYASHGNHVTHVCCQRFELTPHPLHAPALQRAAPDIPPPPRWQTVCRP
jgi:hypothetical protein